MRTIARRTVIQAMSGIAVGSLLGSCGASTRSNAAPAISNPNPQPAPDGTLTLVPITVTGGEVGRIGPRFAGLSYEKSSMALPLFAADNTDLIGLFMGLGSSLLRIGGNSVDQTRWAPDGAGRTSGEVAPADIDALAAFLEQSRWTVLYGVNLATSTPAAAAAEVAYAVDSLGSSLYGIEIGNECDLYGGRYFQTWTLQEFEKLWGEFRAAILQAAPHVLLTGPASAGSISSWTIPFGQSVTGEQIALLTQHYYRGNGQSPTATDAELLSPDAVLVKDLAELAKGTESIGVSFRIAETNSFYNGGSDGVSDSYASALWVIDHLFTIAQGGAVGANLHAGGSGDGYTPIADDNGAVIEARPEYFGLLLFTLAGQGTLLGTTLEASGFNVSAYAVKAADDTLNVVVVNKETDQNLRLSINCGQAVHSAELMSMSGSALNATGGLKIQGSGIGSDGSFAPNPPYTAEVSGSVVTCFLNAISAVLIKVT